MLLLVKLSLHFWSDMGWQFLQPPYCKVQLGVFWRRHVRTLQLLYFHTRQEMCGFVSGILFCRVSSWIPSQDTSAFVQIVQQHVNCDINMLSAACHHSAGCTALQMRSQCDCTEVLAWCWRCQRPQMDEDVISVQRGNGCNDCRGMFM